MTEQNPPTPAADVAYALDVIQAKGPDVEINIVKRDGRIMNIEVTENHRKQLEKHKLKEVV